MCLYHRRMKKRITTIRYISSSFLFYYFICQSIYTNFILASNAEKEERKSVIALNGGHIMKQTTQLRAKCERKECKHLCISIQFSCRRIAHTFCDFIKILERQQKVIYIVVYKGAPRYK